MQAPKIPDKHNLTSKKRSPEHVRKGNFEMLKMTWFVLSFIKKVILSNFKFWRARGHELSECWPMTWSLCVLMNGYEDMNDNVKTQNGA